MEQFERTNDDLLKSMKKDMDELKNAMKQKTTKNLDEMVKMTYSPFTNKILECPLPPKFCLPRLDSYHSLKDPLNHITTINTTLGLQQTPNEILCRSFSTTFKGAAQVWFSKLAPSSIDDFEQLSNSFVCHFIGGQRLNRPTNHLLTIRQEEGESLRACLKQFNRELLEVNKAEDQVWTQQGVTTQFLQWSRNHIDSVLLRNDLFYLTTGYMGLELRYGFRKVLGTQNCPTLRLASSHCVLCLNPIKGTLNIVF